MQNKVIEVIGVDLGDGDTAISKLPMESDASPERLEIDGKKKQITAISFEPDGKIAIGEKAFLSKIIRKLHIKALVAPQNPATEPSVIHPDPELKPKPKQHSLLCLLLKWIFPGLVSDKERY